jgi:hypothetical protein
MNDPEYIEINPRQLLLGFCVGSLTWTICAVIATPIYESLINDRGYIVEVFIMGLLSAIRYGPGIFIFLLNLPLSVGQVISFLFFGIAGSIAFHSRSDNRGFKLTLLIIVITLAACSLFLIIFESLM